MNRNQSIISAIVSLIFAVITLLQSFGIDIPVIDENQVTMMVTGIITVCVWIWGVWKNHNFTQAALAGQEVINDLKHGVSIDVIAERLNSLDYAYQLEDEAEEEFEEAEEIEEETLKSSKSAK